MRRSASLETRLVLGCMVMLGLSLALVLGLITILGGDYARASRNLAALTVYQKVLTAANRLSAERGPMNSVLGEEPAPDTPARRKLAEFRLASDRALAEVAAPGLDEVRARLEAARRAAEALSARPRAERSSAEIRSVIVGMFEVIETMRPVVTAAMAELSAHDRSLAGQALIGQMLGDLREYAGRMGSFLATPIAAREPLSAAVHDELVLTRGRILQIWQTAERQLSLQADTPALAEALREANSRYFGAGLDLIAKLTAEGLSGRYSVTTEEMTEQYVPTLAPLERLRQGFLDDMVTDARATRDSSASWLAAVAAFTALIVLANLILLLAARRHIFQPLLRARDHVVALAEERDLERPARSDGNSSEIRELFGALEILRRKLRERLRLTERLKIQAETDGLTGLLNRRTFDRIGQGDPEFADLPQAVGLILMDIDHFKTINDRHGHAAGDMALRAVASLVADEVRETDLVLRYGGEEIALILPGAPLDALARIAETLRSVLEAQVIDIGEGRTLGVTASFGIATGHRGMPHWGELVAAADAALYAAKAQGRNRVCSARDEQAKHSAALQAQPPRQAA